MSENENQSPRIVLVGVSPTSGSPVALKWAAAEAKARGAELVAVRAWRLPRPPVSPAVRPTGVDYDPEPDHAQAVFELRSHVAGALGEDADVTCKVIRGSPLAVLLKEAADAELLVIDAPPQADLTQTPLLAHRLVYHAPCPVLIMPPTLSDPASPLSG